MPLPPPQAPADLAVLAVFAAEAWPALRGALGDAAPWAPRSLGALVAGELGLPITVAEIVSSDVPVTFVVLVPEGGPTEVVAAFHLRAADRALVLATGGEGARFRAERLPDGMVLLLPARADDVPPAHLAVLGNHLVAASTAEALRRAAGFVVRAPAPIAGSGVLAAADLGPASPRLARTWSTRLAGLVPDLPGLTGTRSPADVAALADALAGGRVELRVSATTLDLTIAAPRSLGAAGAAMLAAQGPPTPWLALPREATFAALVHASAPERVAEASRGAVSLGQALGLAEARRTRFSAALQDLARARSSAVAFALGPTPEGPAAWFRGGVEDAVAADAALDALIAAAGKKAPPSGPGVGPRGGPGGGATISGRATVIERVGDAVRLRVRAGEVAGEEADPVDVLVRREGNALLGAAGLDAGSALRVLRASGTEGTQSLGADPLARRAADAATSHAALLFVDVGATREGPHASRGRAPRAALAASLSLTEGPRLTVLAEPSALVLVHAKLAGTPP